MAVHSYVLSKYVSGTNKSDIELDIHQLTEGDSYVINDPKRLIAEYMFAALENFINPQYVVDDIRDLLDIDGKHKLVVCDFNGSDSVDAIIIKVNNKNQSYYYDLKGGFISRQIYTIKQIDDLNVGYLVTEHIINPYPNCELIERCYKEYFRDLISAKRYRDGKMKHYVTAKGTSSSGYRISVVDVNEIEDSDWYRLNIDAINDIREYNLDPEEYRYIEDLDKLIATIRADSYDDLSIEDQAMVNSDIYKSLRPYISDDYLVFLDEDIDSASEDEVEEIADTAITLALVNAPDEETFKRIHEVLGPNEYRVGALTDNIYNAHPGQGYIIITRDGDMGWYPNCFFINEWEGAKDSPYYGMFQRNENDTLLCLREFHPELIANRLPTKKDMEAYEMMYQEECSVVRHMHSEMYFDVNDEYDDIVCGTWYYEGILVDKHMDDVCFLKDYGSHSFSEDECKSLLSGEELKIENFITKMELEITIRGKLKDCSSIYDQEPNIEFVRTDINSSRRRQLNMEMGIDEPGLPPPSDEDSGI